jgi:tetratricopeptide (TPR) repeat protein
MSGNEPSGSVQPKRFRIAFSFAGEKREFVAMVARILADRFGEDRILYDKYHNAEFSRGDLAFYLPDLYEKDSDLVVAVFCPDYEKKEWCGLEWNAIFGLLKQRRVGEVMLARFGRVEGKGLRGLAGYTDLDDLTPEQAATEFLERLAIIEGKTKDHYTKRSAASGAAPRTSIPHNLPSLQPFFGREDELKKIADALDPESRTWGALIDGPGGMGKTSLAVRAAYEASEEVFEKIVFVSLKSRELDDDGVRDLSGFLISGLAELLNEFARELGRDEIVKAPEAERPRLLLDALRGTRTLLLFDNLESLLKPDRDTVFTFVKKLPVGCKAILTSRVRIGSGAEEVILQELGEDAALATLARLAETNPALAKTSAAERRTLYRQTAGNPLLLRWTAGQIGRGSCLTLSDAIAHLRSCPKGNDPLEFIFGDLVGNFSAAETRALCALSYFTLPAKVEHIASVAGRDEAEAERALKSLVNRSLVVPSEELKTFTLVPLVADFLRDNKPDVLYETGDRLEKYAYALTVENGHEEYDRFPVLEAAWPAVAAALPRFLAGENGRLQTVCSALRHFLEFTGRWDERLALSRDAERIAVAAADFNRAGWRAYDAGWGHYLRGQSADVVGCAGRAQAHWREAQAGARERAFGTRLRGIGHELAKDYPAAIVAYREAVELWRSLGRETSDVAMGLSDLADAEKGSGDLDAAQRDYREALRIARSVKYHEGVAAFTGNLALLALNRKDWPGAEALAREALPLSEKVGKQESIALNCRRLASALLRQGKKAEAFPHARRAVEIFQKLGSKELANAQAILVECES